ncbi:MAG: ion transporter [archaeon]|nr:ion transporter [archaeon]
MSKISDSVNPSIKSSRINIYQLPARNPPKDESEIGKGSERSSMHKRRGSLLGKKFPNVNQGGSLQIEKENKSNSVKSNNSKENFSFKDNQMPKQAAIKKITENPEEDEDEDEEKNLTIRQKINRFFGKNNRQKINDITIGCLAGVSFVYYVLCTYFNKLFKSLNIIDFFVCTVFLFDHIIKIIVAPHSLAYLISIDSVVNFITEIPPYFAFCCKDFYLDSFFRFINITRVLRCIKVYKLLDIFQSGEKDVRKQIIQILSILLLIIFVWAGIMHMLDIGAVEEELKYTFDISGRNLLKLGKYYHHFLYVTIVSLTTVGFGGNFLIFTYFYRYDAKNIFS